jgi:hypothetical protein
MRSLTLLLLILLAGVTAAIGQQPSVRITGVVRDSTGMAMPKTTVSVLGQRQFALTDRNGYYVYPSGLQSSFIRGEIGQDRPDQQRCNLDC